MYIALKEQMCMFLCTCTKLFKPNTTLFKSTVLALGLGPGYFHLDSFVLFNPLVSLDMWNLDVT